MCSTQIFGNSYDSCFPSMCRLTSDPSTRVASFSFPHLTTSFTLSKEKSLKEEVSSSQGQNTTPATGQCLLKRMGNAFYLCAGLYHYSTPQGILSLLSSVFDFLLLSLSVGKCTIVLPKGRTKQQSFHSIFTRS